VTHTPLGGQLTPLALARRTDASPTFRKGHPCEWRETFTDEHPRLFNEAGGNDVLVGMGYTAGGEYGILK